MWSDSMGEWFGSEGERLFCVYCMSLWVEEFIS